MTSALVSPSGIIVPQPNEAFHPCDWCGLPVTKDNRHHSLTLVKNPRINITVARAFCQDSCRLSWWLGAEQGPSHHDAKIFGSPEPGIPALQPAPFLHVSDFNITAVVLEHDPGDPPLRLVSSLTIDVHPRHIRELWQHPTPADLHQWWSTASTLQQHLDVRARFQKLMAQGT